MATTITDVVAYSSPVVVPEGTDFMDDAAEVIIALAQVLANRTAYLKEVADHTARIDQVNTFADTQRIDTANDPSHPMIRSTKSPHDYTIDTSNAWKHFMRVPNGAASGPSDAHIYIGDGTLGLFAIVVNAFWQLSDQKWHQDDSARTSQALIISTSGMSYATQAIGAAGWTTWPTAVGIFSVPTILCLAAVVQNVMQAGTVTAGTGGFLYTGSPTRTTPVRIADVTGRYLQFTDGSVGPNTVDASSGALEVPPTWPLDLPRGAALSTIEVRHHQVNTHVDHFIVKCRHTAFGGGLVDEVVLNQAANATTGDKTTVVDMISLARVVAADEDYRIEYVVDRTDSPSLAGNKVIAIQVVNWVDPGPRNY